VIDEPPLATQRRIVGFHQDPEAHWVAELECGHRQHVRHKPPWLVRSWVTTQQGRNNAMGTLMECRLCDQALMKQ
jgi:hypothetical protein